MKLAHLNTVNAEFDEYLHMVLENLFLEKTSCFLESLSLLEHKYVVDVVYILQHPIFKDENKIRSIFLEKRKKKVNKFMAIIDLYFRKGLRREE